MSHHIGIAALCSFGIALAACSADPASPSNIPEPSSSQASSLLTTIVGTWRQQPSIVTARVGAAAAVSDKSIIVMGGMINEVTSRRVDAYNVETKTWTQLAPMPAARMWHGASTINGKIYVSPGDITKYIDGVYTSRGTKSLFMYDPSTDTWSRKADLPGAVQVTRQAALLGKLYMYDGGSFWLYTPSTDRWSSLPPPPSEHLFGVLSAVGNKIYLTGGGHFLDPGYGYNTELDVYDPVTRTWSVKRPLPTAYTGSVAGSFHGKLWVAGGASITNDRSVSDLYVYDPLTDTWAAGPSMLQPTSEAAAARAGGKFFVIGGVTGVRQPSSFVQALNTPY